jgi:hypothetical protein
MRSLSATAFGIRIALVFAFLILLGAPSRSPPVTSRDRCARQQCRLSTGTWRKET